MGMKYCDKILRQLEVGIKLTPKAFKIGEAAILGMLYEVSTSPSPGLVSPQSCGAHSDMNYLTFLDSTAAIAHSMQLCAQIGMDYEDSILEKIRSVGIYAEKNMMKATKGVNTQRGLLFLAGVVSAAAGALLRRGMELNRANIAKEVSLIGENLVKNELETIENNDKLSNGERLYLKYKLAGIRGEVDKGGLPTVINTGLPFYEAALTLGLSREEALSHTLIGLMSVTEDTTVVNRCGLEGLKTDA